MSRKQAGELGGLYRRWVVTRLENPALSLEDLRDMVEQWESVTGEPGDVDYLETNAGAVHAMWAIPKECADDRVLLCLHGGGFAFGSMYTHRKLYAHLAKSAGCRALIVNYRRAPEHRHPAQLEDALGAYRWLLREKVDSKHIALVGDSAGGGLAVSTLMWIRDHDLPLPATALLLSPWVDMELNGATMESNLGQDALFVKENFEQFAVMLLGEEGNRRQPYVSPLYGDLCNLPPLYIQAGDRELLLDDSVRLAEAARKAGLEARLDIVPEAQHCFLFSAGRSSEANDGIRRWAQWLRVKLALTK